MRNHILIILIITLFSLNSKAQSTALGTVSIDLLNEITLLGIKPLGSINFIFSSPITAGSPIINPIPNTSKWINYTSSIANSNTNKRITVHSSEVLPGIDIKIVASPANSSGAGVKGTSSGLITVSAVAQNLITGIKGAYTGNGTNNGHQITISLDVSNYGNLIKLDNKQITITYTITE